MSEAMTMERREELRQMAAVHPKSQWLDECLDEIGRLSELLWGCRCVYCGELVGKDKQNQDLADNLLREHVLVCPKHPVSKLKAEALHDEFIINYLYESLGPANDDILYMAEEAWDEALKEKE